MTVTRSVLKIDYGRAEEEIVGFIRRIMKEAGAKGAVVGLSGGVDSAVVGALCVKALGKERVVAMLLPSESTPREDVDDATTLAESWGVRTFKVDISSIAAKFFSAIDLDGDRIARGNVHARTRMMMNYYVANTLNLLVAGTGDRSEDLIGFFCYDSATKVVTVDGPKGMNELRKGDTVFSLDQNTGKLVESKVEDVFKFDYDGELIHFSGRGADVMVTPNHRMLVHTSSSNPHSKLVFRRADECIKLRDTITPVPSGWSGYRNLPLGMDLTFQQRHVKRTVRLSIEDTLYLFGLFIGDGSVTKGRAVVPVKSNLTRLEYVSVHHGNDGRFVPISSEKAGVQLKEYDTFETTFSLPEYTKDAARKRLIQILTRYKIGYSLTRDAVRVPSRGIYEFFAQFGIGAKNKHIPPWILRYPSEYLVHLLRGLKDSDGAHPENKHAYYTSSDRLKDDFVQLCFKMGRRASVSFKGPKRPVINGKTINTGPSYTICYASKQRSQHTLKNRLAKKVRYSGQVWCPSVPPYENVLVERNGKYVFSGNTKYGDGGVDFLPIAHLYKTQVRGLAAHLGLPERVVTKPSSPRLWPGHLAADELPADYDTLDVVLYCLFDEKMTPARAAAESGVARGIVDAVLKKYRESAHKRAYPPMVKPW